MERQSAKGRSIEATSFILVARLQQQKWRWQKRSGCRLSPPWQMMQVWQTTAAWQMTQVWQMTRASLQDCHSTIVSYRGGGWGASEGEETSTLPHLLLLPASPSSPAPLHIPPPSNHPYDFCQFTWDTNPPNSRRRVNRNSIIKDRFCEKNANLWLWE